MYEIALSPRSQQLVPRTRYDVAVGFRFDDRRRAESFCHDLNVFCFQDRFVVIRVGRNASAEQILRAAA